MIMILHKPLRLIIDQGPKPIPLPFPFCWHVFQHVRQLQCSRLAAIEDSGDDVGGEEGQAEDAADIGGVDLFDFGQFVDRAGLAGFQHAPPAVRAGERL